MAQDNTTTLIVLGIVGYFAYQVLKTQTGQTTSNVKCVDNSGNVIGVPDANGNCPTGSTPWLP